MREEHVRWYLPPRSAFLQSTRVNLSPAGRVQDCARHFALECVVKPKDWLDAPHAEEMTLDHNKDFVRKSLFRQPVCPRTRDGSGIRPRMALGLVTVNDAHTLSKPSHKVYHSSLREPSQLSFARHLKPCSVSNYYISAQNAISDCPHYIDHVR